MQKQWFIFVNIASFQFYRTWSTQLLHNMKYLQVTKLSHVSEAEIEPEQLGWKTS